MNNILVLHEYTDVWKMMIWRSFVGLGVFLLMLLWHQEKIAQSFLFHQEFHCGSKEPVFKVAKELHLRAHVIMHWHESQFTDCMEPVN